MKTKNTTCTDCGSPNIETDSDGQLLEHYRMGGDSVACTPAHALTEHHKSILAARGCLIEDHGELGRLLVNRAGGFDCGSAAKLGIRRACREALAAAGHDVSDLRVGIFGPFPGN